MNIYTSLFKNTRISKASIRLFLFLVGTKTLCGKLPRIDEVPLEEDKVLKLYAELSSLGLILGTPAHYRLNIEKLKLLEAPENAGESQPAILTLLKTFNDRHSHYKRRKAANDQKSLMRLRALSRKYTGKALLRLIDPFFQSKTGQRLESLSCIDFCEWADRQLRPKKTT